MKLTSVYWVLGSGFWVSYFGYDSASKAFVQYIQIIGRDHHGRVMVKNCVGQLLVQFPCLVPLPIF